MIKSLSRRAATAALVIVLSVSIAPTAAAAKRNDGSFSDRITKIIQQVKEFFTPRVNDDVPIPPIPKP